ncbi:hypothetical protein LOC67_20960 [Stieleria sp. JC731]|uniref:hypothetical protein n=1 Tax=Pirellulaceae TaxID=2691357 RepID=UPI001E54C10C|nr:hypothetical protein [Stieleria sp. JC731]MCC9603026.1 hypothetical protein [Stieleria sp. JC731]
MSGSLSLSIRKRRFIAIAITAIAILLMCMWVKSERDGLGEPHLVSGFAVFAGLVMLILLGVRRRIPFWPLGKASTWTQFHIYTGFFTSAVYLLHVPSIIGDGLLESFLSLLFVMVSASGFYGLYISRTLPKRLTAVGHEHRFDRIPWTRKELATAAESMLKKIAEPSAKDVLETFYQKTLGPFFSASPSFAYVLVPTGTRRRRLLGDLNHLHRYLEQDGRSIAGQFASLVRQRDDLDYQYALQLRLRVWIVFHAIMSLLLLLISIVHIAAVFQFAW